MALIKVLTQGGQVWAHRIRMIRQVCKIAVLSSIVVAIIIFSYQMTQVPYLYYKASWYHLKASFFENIREEVEVDKDFWAQFAHAYHHKDVYVKSKRLSKMTEAHFNHLTSLALTNLQSNITTIAMSFLFFIAFFFIRGTAWQRKIHISGNHLASARWLRVKLRLLGKASKFHLGKLPLIKNSETRHMLITGGTGSGKTVCLFHILGQLRKESQKVVLIDTTGVFVEKYFRPGKDILLHPTDPRSASWHPWVECTDSFDYDALAESFIPQSHFENENYWRTSARALFSSLLMKTNQTQSTTELARWALFEPLSKLCEFVKGTKAAAHMDINSEKTAGSIRSVASAFLGAFEILQDTKDPFSIKNWVQNQNDDSWLFLSCQPSQRSILIPLLGCWFSLATRSLMNLKPDLNRRLWFIVDELPSLNKLRDLEMFLSEARKFGGCAILCLQSPSQLDTIYGRDAKKTIISNCATKVVFSEHDPISAQEISKTFGEREIQEFSEGLSYGAHEVRDGVTISSQKKSVPVVLADDIMSLKPNRAFVKLPGKLPISRIKIKIQK